MQLLHRGGSAAPAKRSEVPEMLELKDKGNMAPYLDAHATLYLDTNQYRTDFEDLDTSEHSEWPRGD
ncbi:hypothetical protein E4U39_002356 [Claviceps sp. Clav50 group G5]|nr:hypothetical protein E4U39_002356 [Claviceps sp. Clav50 group G5]